MARGFDREYEVFGTSESYFQQLPAMLHNKRKKLAMSLESVGLKPIMPEGGYFMIVDISSLSKLINKNEMVSIFKYYYLQRMIVSILFRSIRTSKTWT